MKIVKQIDETHFEVEMEEYDRDRELRVFVAHDYLSISGQSGFCTNLDIKGKYCSGAINCLSNYTNIQIPIRAAQKIFNLIKDHKYMQPDHLMNGDKPNYLWNNHPIIFKDEGNWKVAIRGDEETEYSIISLQAYNKIKSMEQ